jgi:hypothetical protein
MHPLRFGAGLLLITLCASALFVFWASRPFWQPPGGISSGANDYEIDLNMVRNCYPVHLIQPEWLTKEKLHVGLWWSVYEMIARSAILFVLWFVGVMSIYILVSRPSGVPRSKTVSVDASSMGTK